MHTTFVKAIIVAMSVWVATQSTALMAQHDENYSRLWSAVDSLDAEGLARSAHAKASEILALARVRDDQDQILKSLLYQARYTAQLEEDEINTVVQDLRQEIPRLRPASSAVLQSMLADIYWRYYQARRWILMDRGTVPEQESSDIETWDARRLVAETVRLLGASIERRVLLAQEPLANFATLLQGPEHDRNLRPTLYDFLAHRAIDILTNSETGLADPIQTFDFSRTDWLAPAKEFVRLSITSPDSLSREFIVMRTFQALIQSHLADPAPHVLVTVDLERLKYVNEQSTIPDRRSLYILRLQELQQTFRTHPIGTDISFALASTLVEVGNEFTPFGDDLKRWKLKEAHEVCDDAVDRHPESVGATNCLALNTNIESKRATVQVEKTVIPGQPYRARLEYRNVVRLYAAAVRLSDEEMRNLPSYSAKERRQLEDDLTRRRQVFAKSFELAADEDFQTHSTELPLPPLPAGLYALIVGSDRTFSKDNEARAIIPFAASRLAVIERNHPDGRVEARVVDGLTGRPVRDAIVTTYVIDYAAGSRSMERAGETRTDARGRAFPTTRQNLPYTLTVTKGGEKLVGISARYAYGYGSSESQVSRATHFFTDRAIYRPGQTIYFKGILLMKEEDRHAVRANESVVVELVDTNGRVVASQTLNSNGYGTVKGLFTAPMGAGTGSMTIRDSHGAVSVRVEEYKRPRFEVVFDTLAAEIQLGDSVVVSGKARAFSGAPVDGAGVRYRVVRRPIFEPWRYWHFGPYQWTDAEIAVGTVETSSDGSFDVEFIAVPDGGIDPETNPRFRYEVAADVTDLAGETHSGIVSVTVGYASIVLDIRSPEQIMIENPQPITLVAQNLNGTPVAVGSRIVVTRLKSPDRLLRSRLWDRVDRPLMNLGEFVDLFPIDVYDQEDDPTTWSSEKDILDEGFDTSRNAGIAPDAIAKWKPGQYRVKATASDAKGREVRSEKIVTVYSVKADRPPYPTLDWFVAAKPMGEPGENAQLLIGTSADDAEVSVEVERKDQPLETRIVKLSNEQRVLDFPIRYTDRGNFAVHLTYVRFGRLHTRTELIQVPYTDRQLTLKLETFRDLLYPGAEEEWRLRISGSKGEPVVSELMASLYDASLDQFVVHDWYFNPYESRIARLGWRPGEWWGTDAHTLEGRWNKSRSYRQRRYENLNWFGLDRFLYRPRFDIGFDRVMAPSAMAPGDSRAMKEMVVEGESEESSRGMGGDADVPASEARPSHGAVRTNFNETAFFYPDLEADASGEVVLKFRIPEALTRWKLLGLAHTRDVRFGQIAATTETRKDLMIVANAPRFLREGDVFDFAASVQNLSDMALSGTATLSFLDVSTMKPVDVLFSNSSPTVSFEIEAGRSEGLQWSITVPDGLDMVVYRLVADAGEQSDGEQKALPVLSNRMLVTESLPLPMRGPGTKQFTFDKLRDNRSLSLRHHSYSLEFTPNPVWYAVQALPYMMEFPHECSEQVFSRLYANSIAAHIVEQNPTIQQVFNRWRDIDADALQSNLEKNAELKSLVIEETPWLRAAQDESERKRRIGVLFDFVRMAAERERAVQQLVQGQYATGAWPWFAGMPPNRYVTQHIVAGFGHLRRLGAFDPAENSSLLSTVAAAAAYLDAEIKNDYDQLVAAGVNLDDRHLSQIQIHYLYARSFFNELPVPQDVRIAHDYFVRQAQKYWLENAIYTRGMIGLALHRLGDTDIPKRIIRSLRELALHSDELGMYWKYDSGYYWYQAPIETQALLVEAFDEINDDAQSVADMQLWLLKQKQAQDWKTTKATTEAVYALLMRGTRLLDEGGSAVIQVGDRVVRSDDPASAEPGTGYVFTSWESGEVTRDLATIEVTKTGPGPAWGAAYWQYFENLDRITSAETPLRIEKRLFMEETTNSGPVLRPLDKEQVSIGDKIVVRVTIRVDRDMEYVHLKDMRAAGLEPINVLSGYKYGGGLGYYESTRDAATHFFIGYLRKGTYVFEYPLRVNLAGEFSNGITSMQSMYAPEFSSHSAGARITIKQ